MTRRPVFLERRSYRRRRALDGARLLPVLGVFLFLMPLVWAAAPGDSLSTAMGGIYLFGVWGGLIIAAFVFAQILGRREADESGPEE